MLLRTYKRCHAHSWEGIGKAIATSRYGGLLDQIQATVGEAKLEATLWNR